MDSIMNEIQHQGSDNLVILILKSFPPNMKSPMPIQALLLICILDLTSCTN